MNKEYLGALERLAMPDELHIKECKRLGIGLTEDYNMLKQYFESIDNASPSEALKSLKIIGNCWLFGETDVKKAYSEQYDTIEQYILKAQEQEKENAELKRVLEVLFKKQVDLGWLWYCVHECINSLDEYNKKMPIEKFKLTQEEFDLLGKWSRCLSH